MQPRQLHHTGMKLVFFTLVLDGMPWITEFYPQLRQLDFDWQWVVVEGVAAPEKCTSWCGQQAPRLSEDGTTGYLDSIASYDKRIVLYRKELWHGKVEMCNRAIHQTSEPCLLVQADSDELWTAAQLTTMREMFLKQPAKNAAYFRCHYMLGPRIEIMSRGGYGNNESYEWLRAWRWEPGMRFKTHEPPVMETLEGKAVPLNAFSHDETKKAGLVFRHESWSTLEQVKRKAAYYGTSANKEHGKDYKNAVEGWLRLQENTTWPVDLKDFLPWVGDGVEANITRGV